MNTIVFLGTKKSGSSRDAINAAEQLGYFTCLLTDNYKQMHQRHEYPEVHLMEYCDLNDIIKVRNMINHLIEENLNICAIVSFTDPWCGLASKMAEEYGLNSFSTKAIYTMQNKLKSREVLKNTLHTPEYFIINNETNIKCTNIKDKFPVVVKYVDSNGSKDVYSCDDCDSYYKYSRKLLNEHPDGNILVEEYLDGPQYIVETVVINKKIYIVAIVEQEIKFINEHFIITGYKLLINYTDEFYDKLSEAVKVIIRKHKLDHGPCHLEMRLVKDEWKLVEVNPRISGAGMNQLILTGLGINLVEETLKLSLDLEVNLEPRFKKYTFAEYVTLDKSGILLRTTGRNQVLNSSGVEFVYVKPKKGSLLTPPVSLGNRYAYVIATGDTEEDAKNNAKNAASKIMFHISEY